MRRVVLIAVGLLVLAVAGCGGGEDGPDKAVHAYFNAIADGDAEAACAQLSGEARRDAVDYVAQNLPEVNAVTCRGAVGAITENIGGDEASRLRNADVVDTKIDGDTATVTIAGATRTATLTKADGRWYIDGGLFDE